MTIPAGVIFPWVGNHATIPEKWLRETTLDGKYAKAWGDLVAPDETGGAATHTHTSPVHSHTLNAHTHTYSLTSAGTTSYGTDPSASGFRWAIIDTHTHTGTSGAASGGTTGETAVTYGAVSNDPPFYSPIFIKAENGALIPDDLIAFWLGFEGDLTTPDNWQYCNGTDDSPDLRNKYLKGAATASNAGATGGSTTNVHDISHTHTSNSHTHVGASSGAPVGTIGGGGNDNAVRNNHTHTVTLAAGTETINSYSGSLTTAEIVEPAYIKVGAIQKKTDGRKERGIIGLWLGAIADIPQGWVVCDGENGTTDLRDKFIKIATDSSEFGDTGGSNTHTHAAQSHTHTSGTHSHTGSASAHVYDGVVEVGASNPVHRTIAGSVHPVASVETKSAGYASATTEGESSSNEPEYRTAAYIQFQRELGGGSFLFNFLEELNA